MGCREGEAFPESRRSRGRGRCLAASGRPLRPSGPPPPPVIYRALCPTVLEKELGPSSFPSRGRCPRSKAPRTDGGRPKASHEDGLEVHPHPHPVSASGGATPPSGRGRTSHRSRRRAPIAQPETSGGGINLRPYGPPPGGATLWVAKQLLRNCQGRRSLPRVPAQPGRGNSLSPRRGNPLGCREGEAFPESRHSRGGGRSLASSRRPLRPYGAPPPPGEDATGALSSSLRSHRANMPRPITTNPAAVRNMTS